MRAEKRAPGGRPLTTGGMPSALRMAAIVDRATRWPTFFSAPCIGVYPQRGFSLAIRTARCRISASAPGRPRRLREYVHFRTISSRCHRRIVSGVTSVATSRNTARPSRCPSCARRRRCGSVNRGRRPASCVFSTRFSSRRNAITSRCSRSSHPSSAARSICNGNTAVSLRQCAARVFRHYELSPFTHRDGKFATPLALPVSSRTWSPVFARSTT